MLFLKQKDCNDGEVYYRVKAILQESIFQGKEKPKMNGWQVAVRLLTRFEPSIKQDESRKALITAWFPVIGAAMGILLWLTALFCLFLMNRILGTIVAAVLVPVLFWWLNGGKYLKNIMLLLDQWTAQQQAETQKLLYMRLLTLQAGVTVKVIGIALLIYFDYSLWLVLLPVFSATILAQYAAEGSNDLLQQSKFAYMHWAVAAIVTATISGIMEAFAAGALLFIIILLMSFVMRQFLLQAFGKMMQKEKYVAAGLTDLVVLLVGVLYFLAG